jgi:photosystem II stability/assembly factor-like uncharacterized protein
LYTLCTGNGAAGSLTKEVVRTEDAKTTLEGTAPFGGSTASIAATASGTIVVGASSGASYIYLSPDGGHTWSTAETYDDGGMGFNDLGFTTASQGVAVHGFPGTIAGESSQLLMTHDGGAIWQVVEIS